jgi:hypothetical protein
MHGSAKVQALSLCTEMRSYAALMPERTDAYVMAGPPRFLTHYG